MSKNIQKIIAHFNKVDSGVAQILSGVNIDDWLGSVEKDKNRYFEDLCRTIVGQQLSGRVAEVIYKRFSSLLEEHVTPVGIMSLDEQNIRNVGLSWAKVRSVKDLSERVLDGRLDLNTLDFLSDEELFLELSKVKGIGRWTAEMFLMFRLGHEDIFSMGDLGLKNGLKKYLNKEEMSLEEIKVVTDKWKPYRTYGAIAMWHLLDNR